MVGRGKNYKNPTAEQTRPYAVFIGLILWEKYFLTLYGIVTRTFYRQQTDKLKLNIEKTPSLTTFGSFISRNF